MGSPMTSHKNGSIEGGRISRAQIVKLLRKPRTVNELSDALSLHRSATSRNLEKLEAMGIARRAEKIGHVQIWELAAQPKPYCPTYAIGGPETAQVGFP